jgi:hypothetical protein
MMEYGIAHINNGIGVISTAKGPQPVKFKIAVFSSIVDGETVVFLRSESSLDWASKVISASKVDTYLGLATPATGLTLGAQSLVLRHAARFALQADAAPTAEQSAHHVKYASKAMAAVAKLGEATNGPLGVRAVRSVLK